MSGNRLLVGALLSAMAVASVFRDQPEEIKISGFRCNIDLIRSYGLMGLESPRDANGQYCPLVSSSCCTEKDEETSMKVWKSTFMPRLVKHYELYLYSLRFLLGYANQGALLAGDFVNSPTSQCYEIAKEFRSTYTNTSVNSKIYKLTVNALEKVSELRRGFFCMACDAKFHQDLVQNDAKEGDYYSSRLFYSKSFCYKLTKGTINSAYYSVTFLPTYAENLASIIDCKMQTKVRLTFEVDYWSRQHVKNCFYFGKKYFFFYCERYCEMFSMTNSSPIFDGNIAQVRTFVDMVTKYRDEAFYQSKENSLIDVNSYDEKFNEDFFEEVLKSSSMIPAVLNGPSLNGRKTDILFDGGYDPYLVVEKNEYPIEFSSAPLEALAALLLGVLALVL